MTGPQYEIRSMSTGEGSHPVVVTAFDPTRGEVTVAVTASNASAGALSAAIEHALRVKTSAASAARAD